MVVSLKNCTKGTDEWYTALEGVKNKVKEILDKYPDLLKYNDLLQWDDHTGTYLFNEDPTKGTTID